MASNEELVRRLIARHETDYQLLRDDYEMIAAGESAALECIASLEAEVERLRGLLGEWVARSDQAAEGGMVFVDQLPLLERSKAALKASDESEE